MMKQLLRIFIFALLFVGSATFAAGAIRQESSTPNINLGSSTTTTTPAFGTNCLIGSAIEVYVTWSSSLTDAPSMVQDSAGQNYTLVPNTTLYTAPNSTSISIYLLQTNASATALTVTATLPNAPTGTAIWAKEITGVGIFTAGNGQDQSAPGTGTDVISTGAITGTPTAPYFISSLTTNAHGDSPAPVAGTGFTSTSTGWNYSGNPLSRSESKAVASGSTPNSATYTDATFGATSGEYLTVGVLYPTSGVVGAIVGGGMINVPLRGLP